MLPNHTAMSPAQHQGLYIVKHHLRIELITNKGYLEGYILKSVNITIALKDSTFKKIIYEK